MEGTWRYSKTDPVFSFFLSLFLQLVKQALFTHLSVLVAHDLSQYVFIKIGNFLLGGGMGTGGVEFSLFPLSPLGVISVSGSSQRSKAIECFGTVLIKNTA